MCIHPITIKNPYYKIHESKVTSKTTLGNKGLNYLHNTHSKYIQVPCGSCSQCLSLRQQWFNQRVQMESLRSHLFMFTLTYNDESLVYTDIGEYQIAYPLYSDVQNMFKRLRKDGYKFRYWVTSEYGSIHKRPHFHGILALDKSVYTEDISVLEHQFYWLILREWRRNYGSSRKPLYKPLCTYVRRRNSSTYDFHKIIPIKDHDSDCSFYVSKYILKYDKRTTSLLQKILLDENLTPEQSDELYKMIKPRSVMSKDFGSWKDERVSLKISSDLDKSIDLPQFYDLYSGNSSLLSPYYRNHLLSVEWKQRMHEHCSLSSDTLELPDKYDSMYEYAVNSRMVFEQDNKLKSQKDLLNRKY